MKERLLHLVDPAAAVAPHMSRRARAAFSLCVAALLVVLAARVAPQAAPPVANQSDGAVAAVHAGLGWLLRHQESDGHFSAAGFAARCNDPACAGKGEAAADIGVTALAAAALMGAGGDGPERGAVEKALDWLVTQQDPTSGLIASRGNLLSHRHYDHVYATLVLVDGFGLYTAERWKRPAQQALDYLLKVRNPYRGWRYGAADGDNDSSLTGTVVYVLAGSRTAGFTVDQAALDGGISFLDDMTDESTGRTGYQQKGGKSSRTVETMNRFAPEHGEALTAIAMNARIQAGQQFATSPLVAKGVALLAAKPPRWDEAKGSIDYCYWHYGTRALFLLQGAAWRDWKSAVVRELTTHQCTQGDGAGSFPPIDPWSDEGGRVYATAINLLTLEICARKL